MELVIDRLSKQYKNKIAVDRISLKLGQGVYGLLGANGAGKTTTFRMLCGLLPSTSGFLSVAGVDLRTARAQARLNIGYVAQKFSLYQNLTVEENLIFFGGTYGLKKEHLKHTKV